MKVVIKARMRRDGSWENICIRDISSRGLLLQASSPPPRGTYIDVYRGRHVITARVVWAKDQKFGVQTQGRLDVGSIVKEPDASTVDFQEAKALQPSFERRRSQRQDAIAAQDRAKRLSRAGEFLTIGAFAACAALFFGVTVTESFAKPLAHVSNYLGR